MPSNSTNPAPGKRGASRDRTRSIPHIIDICSPGDGVPIICFIDQPSSNNYRVWKREREIRGVWIDPKTTVNIL